MRFVDLSAMVALVAFVASPAAVFVACSSTNETAPTVATDAGDASAPDDAAIPVEAAPSLEQPADVYPSMHEPIPQLTFLKGKVLDHMKVVTVTFVKAANTDGGVEAGVDSGTDDGGDAGDPTACTPSLGDSLCPTLRRFDDTIVTSDWWHQTMTGYNVMDGEGIGHAELDEAAVHGSITDSDIQLMIQTNIDNGKLPPPVDQILYAMYFPMATQIGGAGGGVACVDYLGYHFSANVTHGGQDTEVAYAVIPRCQPQQGQSILDTLTVTASHEFAEAASDPYPATEPGYRLVDNDAWVPSIGTSSAGNENGDVCIFAPNYTQDSYQVQPIWSNQAAAESREPCQPASGTYYGAAVRTVSQKVNNHTSRGYLVLNKGESQDAIIDFFSTAKLAHDVALFAGGDKANGDPTDMSDIRNGITAKFSRTKAHNGNGLIMTVSAPATAVKGDYKFLVRSVLEQNDFHDWPVIVHIN